ncbi:MAG TPA: hypothetical protein EYO53_03665 [Alphaproteobacteria bacterium]|nr:hypothetical protein [Alphaproteobacteria bacterium]
MSLAISTFSNKRGGDCLFKALGHPLVVPRLRVLLSDLERTGPVAIYDPHNAATTLAALYATGLIKISDVYVQKLEDLNRTIFGQRTQPVSALSGTRAKTLFVVAYDADSLIHQIQHLLPQGVQCVTLDAARLPDEMLTSRNHYLTSLNFATNFVFFRDADGFHTRLMSANYWHRYGARGVKLWLQLFDEAGHELASWKDLLPDSGAGFTIDSQQVRSRYDTGPFVGQLYIHAVNVRGHDVVKYALDIYGDDTGTLSCTHDANAWPSDLYAGLPAPAPGERVTLWVQNSHPTEIPPNSIGLNRMGSQEVGWLGKGIAPFGSYALDVSTLLPELAWPEQIEIRAGKYMVRPRYEIDTRVNRRIAHVNVERTDLVPDKRLAELGNLVGKGHILPAPLLPTERYETIVLPTPMSTGQLELAIKLLIFDSEGQEIYAQRLGRLPRDHAVALSMNELLGEVGTGVVGACGHVELIYDFNDGSEADGWLHALFRYRDLKSGHAAETSFGSHMFNLPVTFRNEPQSYGGPPPGLSTRLYLRLGVTPLDTICYLIYPASIPWRAHSDTALTLIDSTGIEIAAQNIQIPCGGSRLICISELFNADLRARAGVSGYIQVRDLGCRLFGYHGLTNGQGAFSLDHMFGF